jgi:hypothetical protein
VITDPGAAAGLIARLNLLTPESRGEWGRMSAHGMLCHVADVALGIRRLPGAPARPRKAFRAFLGLHTPFPWPKGIRTPAPVDQEKGGTPPGEFEADRVRAIAAIEAQAAAKGGWPEYHPIFGKLSEWEWQRFAWRHTDHHLRQFGF